MSDILRKVPEDAPSVLRMLKTAEAERITQNNKEQG